MSDPQNDWGRLNDARWEETGGAFALDAWNRVRGVGTDSPDHVVVLYEKGSTGVYLLPGAGPAGRAVIAKRTSAAAASLEAAMYERWLPDLQLPSLAFYGSAQYGSGSCFFIEYAGGELLDSSRQSHAIAAATWLANLHTRAANRSPADLPDRGVVTFRNQLEVTMGRLGSHPRAAGGGERSCTVVASLLQLCERVEAGWSRLEAVFEAAPRTLVHGDCLAKNFRISRRRSSDELLAFDWEHAGWGSPFLDLVQSGSASDGWLSPDLDSYMSAVGTHWPDLSADRVREGARLAGVLHLITWIYSVSSGLSTDWRESAVARLARYGMRLEHLLEEYEWQP